MVDEDDDGGIVVRLPAVLDIFSAGPLRICIHELLADGHRRVRLDMTEVIVIEAEGLEMLEEARATAGEVDAQVDFIQPSKDISNVLDLAGMEKRAPRDPSSREHPSRQGRER